MNRNGCDPDPLEPPIPASQVVGGSRRTAEHRPEYSTLFWRFLAVSWTYQAGLAAYFGRPHAALRRGPGVTAPFICGIEIVFFRHGPVASKRHF